MKIAIVHEFLNQFGGAERVLLSLHKIFPEAPFYVLIQEKNQRMKDFNNLRVETSCLQPWYELLNRKQKLFLPYYPYAIEQFDFSNFDLVISSSNSFAKGVITSSDCVHICYCHSPTRYLWDYTHEYLEEQTMSNIIKPIVSRMLDRLRIWDYQAAQRVDYFIANSNNVKKRIKKYYHCDSEVIYPPANISKFNLNAGKRGDYFLVVGRLSTYKKTNLVLDAFKGLNDKLIIIGEGADAGNLNKKSPKNIIFKGFVDDLELSKYYQNCRALIFPQEEDFGIIPVEAMATGAPIIAYKKGGALETVIEGKTGIFFSKQSAAEIRKTIKFFKKVEKSFNPQIIRKQAEKFNETIFIKRIEDFIKKKR